MTRTNNEKILLKIYYQLYKLMKDNKFVGDKSDNKSKDVVGTKCVEIINANIKGLDPTQSILDFGPRKTPKKYCEKELNWYLSENLNIKGYVDDVKIWQQVCDKDGFINSNYGNLVFGKENYKQYQHTVEELKNNKNSRRALIIFTRPSIWLEYNMDGMSDFICTISAQVFIRNNKLIYINTMRSNDSILGFGADFYFACYVYNRLYNDLKKIYSDLEIGYIDWNVGSFHLYEAHFKLLEDIINENKEILSYL
jgi:thymidylate synthase